MQDAVFWGAIVAVGITIVILIFLVFKVLQLMKRDAATPRPESDT